MDRVPPLAAPARPGDPEDSGGLDAARASESPGGQLHSSQVPMDTEVPLDTEVLVDTVAPPDVPGAGDSATETARANGSSTTPRSAGGVAPVSTVPRATRARARWALRVALTPWVLSRAIVLGALAVAREFVADAHPSAAAAARVHQGLLGWDASWYRIIAAHGYAGAGHDALRFFPLLPALTRLVALVPGLGIGAALLVVGNVAALVGTAALVLLAWRETGDEGLARRAAWLVSLAPPAFTMVMGYAEGLLLVLGVGTMLALRRGHWWWAAGLAALAGLTRPLGVLLAVPAVVEGLRHLPTAPWRERIGRAAAVLGGPVGCGAFLAWVGWRYGDALAPLRLQQQAVHHGRFVDPLSTLVHDASLIVHDRHLGTALHLPWVVLSVALLVVAFRRWPASYGAFAAAVLAVSLTGANLDSFERYALSAFPLVLAAASLTARVRVERCVLVLAAAGLAGYALLAFTNIYVP